MLSRLKGKSSSSSKSTLNDSTTIPTSSSSHSITSTTSSTATASSSSLNPTIVSPVKSTTSLLLPKRNGSINRRPRSQTYSLPPTSITATEWNNSPADSLTATLLTTGTTTAPERRRSLNNQLTPTLTLQEEEQAEQDERSRMRAMTSRSVSEAMLSTYDKSSEAEEDLTTDQTTHQLGGVTPIATSRTVSSSTVTTVHPSSSDPTSRPTSYSGLSALAGINLSDIPTASALPASARSRTQSRSSSRSPSIHADPRTTGSASSSRKSTLVPPLIQIQQHTSKGIKKSRSRSSSNAGDSPAMSSNLRSYLVPLSASSTRSSYDGSGDIAHLGHPEAMLEDRAFRSMNELGDFDDVINQFGTGYAVASSKRNNDFHNLFKAIPDDDYLIEDYGCALQREILIQGRLYISEHHLSFNANIFGWITTHVLPFSEILSIEKKMTAYVIPNAIQITTPHARHTFASFLSRDTTFDLIVNIWRMAHPAPLALSDRGDDGDEHSEVDVSNRKNLSPLKTRGRGDTLESNASSEPGSSIIAPSATSPDRARPALPRVRTTTSRGDQSIHEPTVDSCPLQRNLKAVALDAVFASTPEKVYNLMFTSGFMKDFWINNQKLTELQLSDWAPASDSAALLSRSVSYIKPLSAPIGPRQTKCVIIDENAHVDFDDFVCVITTTRTPDVPSGSAFAVKTRTSITWAKGNSCRVIVTTGVEWSKSSFLKGIIERSCIEGQRAYHAALEKAMRSYIHQHRSEFLEEGHPESLTETSSLEGVDESQGGRRGSGEMISREESHETTLHAGGGIMDIFVGFKRWLESIEGVTPLAVGFIVLVLVVSNLWTLTKGSSQPIVPSRSNSAFSSPSPPSTGSSSSSASNGPPQSSDEVANAVRSVLQDYFAGMAASTASEVVARRSNPEATVKRYAAETGDGMSRKEEVEQMERVLDQLELRIREMRGSLVGLA